MDGKIQCLICLKLIDDTTEQRSKHRNRNGCNGLPFNKRGPKGVQKTKEKKKTKRVQEAENQWQHCGICKGRKLKN